jgi:HisJ family histidinol phosphate phosphatase
MPYSHHSHSGQFCKHASGTLEDVVLEAINQGFELYGLTEHVPRYREADLYPEEVSYRSSRVQINKKPLERLECLLKRYLNSLNNSWRKHKD